MSLFKHNVDGLQFISVNGKLRRVMEEEPNHYHVAPQGFIVYKKYIKKVRPPDIGIYDVKVDTTGRMITDKKYRQEFVDDTRKMGDLCHGMADIMENIGKEEQYAKDKTI